MKKVKVKKKIEAKTEVKKKKRPRQVLDTLSLSGRPKKSTSSEPVSKEGPHRDATFKLPEIKLVCEMIRQGASRSDAAKFFGSHTEVLRKTLKRYPAWELMVEQAEVDCKLHHLSKVHDGDKMWKASAWFLSRKWYGEFAQRTPDSYTKEQVMSLLLAFGRLISEEIKDADVRSRVLGRVQDLTQYLQTLKTQKAKSDVIHDGDGD